MGVREESTLGFAVVVSSLQIFADMETRERGVGSDNEIFRQTNACSLGAQVEFF